MLTGLALVTKFGERLRTVPLAASCLAAPFSWKPCDASGALTGGAASPLPIASTGVVALVAGGPDGCAGGLGMFACVGAVTAGASSEGFTTPCGAKVMVLPVSGLASGGGTGLGKAATLSWRGSCARLSWGSTRYTACCGSMRYAVNGTTNASTTIDAAMATGRRKRILLLPSETEVVPLRRGGAALPWGAPARGAAPALNAASAAATAASRAPSLGAGTGKSFSRLSSSSVMSQPTASSRARNRFRASCRCQDTVFSVQPMIAAASAWVRSSA